MLIETPIGEIEDKQFRVLCEFTQSKMEEFKVPGLSIGIFKDGEYFSNGFGVTNVEHPLAVTSDTLFQIGSITKTFTGTVVMALVEQGKLALDDPIRNCIPDFKLRDEDVAARVTMRHLLSHTGGWEGDYFNDYGDGDDAQAKMLPDIATMPQYFPLGKYFSYNNTGFTIAGRVIEVMTGKTYEQVVQELIFEPLALEKTFFFERDVMLHRFAVGHVALPDKTIVLAPWPVPRAAVATGRIISSICDLLIYGRFHLGNGTSASGKRILSPDAMKAMQTVQAETPEVIHRGLAWGVGERNGEKVVAHGGGTLGQSADLSLFPEHNMVLAILTNANTMIIPKIQGFVMENYLNADTSNPKPIEKNNYSEYLGRYSTRVRDIDISIEDGQLQLLMTQKGKFPKPDSPAPPVQPPALNLSFYDDEKVFVSNDGAFNGTTGMFIRDEKGKIIGFRMGGRIGKRLEA